MRVPNLSLYSNSKYNLMGLTSDLQDSNEVMSTHKRINSLSDDPIGMSQTLNLKTTIENLTQIEKNVNMGISWLKGGENAMDSVSDLILEVKTEVTRLINDSMSIDERQGCHCLCPGYHGRDRYSWAIPRLTGTIYSAGRIRM